MAEGAQAHEPRMLSYEANVRWAAAAADADIAPDVDDQDDTDDSTGSVAGVDDVHNPRDKCNDV